MDLKNHNKNNKNKKCQPAAGDMPDLIQTEHVPSSWLARPNKKITKTRKSKKMSKTEKSKQTPKQKTNKKCQPAAGDMPDIIQTEHVPSSWLACPNKKITKTRKSKKNVKN